MSCRRCTFLKTCIRWTHRYSYQRRLSGQIRFWMAGKSFILIVRVAIVRSRVPTHLTSYFIAFKRYNTRQPSKIAFHQASTPCHGLQRIYPTALDSSSTTTVRTSPLLHKLTSFFTYITTVTERSRTTSLMMSVRNSWLALSLTDIALLNIKLAHYAADHLILTGQGDPMEAISFTAESIRIINERMNWPDQRTSDGTIAAVAGMALQEVSPSSLNLFSWLGQEISVHVAKKSRQLTNAIDTGQKRRQSSSKSSPKRSRAHDQYAWWTSQSQISSFASTSNSLCVIPLVQINLLTDLYYNRGRTPRFKRFLYQPKHPPMGLTSSGYPVIHFPRHP